MTTFIPDALRVQDRAIPYFEDNPKEKIPGRGTEKSLQTLQTEIITLLSRLGAGTVQFVPGQYPGTPKRYGFQITFWYGGMQGRMDCAALPMRKETERRKDRALAQALYLLRDELQAMVYSVVHKPGAIPLIPYLIGANGKTVTEHLVETQNVPQLLAGTAS